MASFGFIRCGYVDLPIVRIELATRAFLLHCERWGPLLAYSGPGYVFGHDGTMITGPHSDYGPNNISWTVVRPGCLLSATFRCSFDHFLPSEASADIAHYRRSVSGGRRQLTRGQ